MFSSTSIWAFVNQVIQYHDFFLEKCLRECLLLSPILLKVCYGSLMDMHANFCGSDLIEFSYPFVCIWKCWHIIVRVELKIYADIWFVLKRGSNNLNWCSIRTEVVICYLDSAARIQQWCGFGCWVLHDCKIYTKFSVKQLHPYPYPYPLPHPLPSRVLW